MQLRTREIATLTEGQLYGQDVAVCGVSTDTRRISTGALFIALRGSQFDGDNFVVAAQAAGAAAAIVHAYQPIDFPQIVVRDTRAALAILARRQRRQSNAKVIALTGSNGKTTTKEMLRCLLASRGRVLATQGNLNNDIGVPLTLLRLSGDEDFAVIEMGANHIGEIAYLVGIAEPDIVLVTNVATAHLEGFGSLAGVIQAKGEMYAASGYADIVLNEDLPCAAQWRTQYGARIKRSFSLSGAADIYATVVAEDGRSFTLCQGSESAQVHWTLIGKHNVANALAAFAVASLCGVRVMDAASAFCRLNLTQGRLTAYSVNGSVVYDDTYNANPASFRAGIDVIAAQSPSLVIAGAMGELGEQSTALHREVAEYARNLGISAFWCVNAPAYGETDGWLSHFDDVQSAARQLCGWLAENHSGAVLVKGSRSAQMERVLALAQIGCSAPARE